MRFLFDVHVHRGARQTLRERGIDAVHAVDLGLGDAPDHVLLERAVQEDRIVVTRDVADFATLVEAYVRAGRDLPGVLFLPRSIRPADAGAHVRAVVSWGGTVADGENPVSDTYAWLSPVPAEDEDSWHP